MIRKLAFLLLLAPTLANAITSYYSRCDTGAHASCVAGSDSNDGLSPETPRLTAPTSTQFNAASCGDQFLLAKGSRWDGYASGIIDHGTNCASNPVVIGAYDPPSGATGRPQLYSSVTSDDSSMLVFGSYNNTSDDRGYLVQGIELFSSATRASSSAWSGGAGSQGTEFGVRIFGRTSYVTFDDVYIHNFRIGMEYIPNLTIADPTIDHITVKNSTISENSSMGILGAVNDWIAVDNLFEGNNFSGNGQNHAIYVNAPSTTPKRITFRRNRFLNNSVAESWSGFYDGAGVCTGGTVTMHGILDGITVEDNILEQTVGANVTCYGLSATEGYGDVDEVFNNIKFRRNRITNYLSAIVYETAPGIEIDSNVITTTLTSAPNAYIFAQGASDHQASAIVRNNSLYVCTGVAIDTNQSGTPADQVVANNLIQFWCNTGTRSYFSHDAITTYTAFDGNLGYNGTRFSSTYPTAGAENDDCPGGTASFDCNGVRADPLLVAAPSVSNDYSMQLQVASPAVGAGVNAHCTRITKDGKVRTGNCTIGAYQPGL